MMEHINTFDYFEAVQNLIKDDLRTSKLINRLSDLGLDTSPYQAKFPETIFTFFGFKKHQQTDELKDWYFQLAEQINKVKFEMLNDEVERISNDIYYGLIERVQKIQGVYK